VLTNGSDKDVKRSTLDIRRTAEVNQFDVTFAIKNDILVLDVSVDNLCIKMQVSNSLCDLTEDLATFRFVHGDAKLNVVEQVHPR
jgi:hypothetical protein